MKKLTLLFLLAISPAAYADEDLTLPDARFLTTYNRVVCDSFDEAGIQSPESFTGRHVVIEKLLGDRMVLNFLITATYQGSSAECRYSALLARGRKNTMVKTESKAYSADPATDCSEGKQFLDETFAQMPFSYTTNPIKFIGLKVPVADAVGLCGEGAKKVKIVFERQKNIPREGEF